jgi:hypothetical protein
MGVDPLRFAEVDVSSALNNFGGWYNAPNYPNFSAFAAVKANKSWYSHYQRVHLRLQNPGHPTP